MKNFVVTMSLLMLTKQGFSTSKCSHLISEDQSIFLSGSSIDVVHKNDITLLFAVSNFKAPPKVTLTEEAGFECRLKTLKRFDQCLALTFSWSPGADSSGCFINVEIDGTKYLTSELYMNF